MTSIKLAGCAPLFVLLAVGGLRAEVRDPGGRDLQSPDLASPVQSGSQTTYFDLLRELFPDLTADATAHRTIPLGSIP